MRKLPATLSGAVLMLVVLVTGAIASVKLTGPSVPGIPACSKEQVAAEQVSDCADWRGEGVSINDTRYYSCRVTSNAPCFAVQKNGTATTYTLHFLKG